LINGTCKDCVEYERGQNHNRECKWNNCEAKKKLIPEGTCQICDDYQKGVKGAEIKQCKDSRTMNQRPDSLCTLDKENARDNDKRGY